MGDNLKDNNESTGECERSATGAGNAFGGCWNGGCDETSFQNGIRAKVETGRAENQ